MGATLSSPNGRTILGSVPVTIGKAQDNQLVLDDVSVEAHHAEIRLEGTGYRIVDMGTSNGTFVNDLRLAPNASKTLRDGDIVRVGKVKLNYQTTSEPAAATTSGTTSAAPIEKEPVKSTSYTAPTYNTGNTAPRTTPAQHNAPPPARPPQKSMLWPLLLGASALALIGLFTFTRLRGSSSTPTQAYQGNTATQAYHTFCNAINAHNGGDAFNQVSANFQKLYSRDQINLLANNTTNCTSSEIDDKTGIGVITYDFGPTGKVVADGTAVLQDNNWKLDAQHLRSSPTATLYQFCSDIKKADYGAAYNQYAGDIRKDLSADQFTNQLTSMGMNDCKLSNPNDADHKGAIDYSLNNGQTKVIDYELVDDNGTWKISKQTDRP